MLRPPACDRCPGCAPDSGKIRDSAETFPNTSIRSASQDSASACSGTKESSAHSNAAEWINRFAIVTSPIRLRIARLALFPQRARFLAARKNGFLFPGQFCGPDTTQALLHDEFAERDARCKRFFRTAPRNPRPGTGVPAPCRAVVLDAPRSCSAACARTCNDAP